MTLLQVCKFNFATVSFLRLKFSCKVTVDQCTREKVHENIRGQHICKAMSSLLNLHFSLQPSMSMPTECAFVFTDEVAT